MKNIIKLILGLSIFFGSILYGNTKGTQKTDNYMIFLVFSTIGIRTFFCVIPDYASAIRCLQGSWYLYLYDIPLLYYFGRCLKRKFRQTFKCDSMTDYCIIVLLILNFFSITRAIYKPSAFGGAFNYLKFAWIYLVMKNMVNLQLQRKYVITGLSVATYFQGTLGILQKITGQVIGFRFLGEAETAFRTRELNGIISKGIAGTFAHSADFALFMLFAMTVFIFNEDILKKKTWLFNCFLTLVCIYLAESRTVLGLAMFVIAYYYIHNFQKKISVWKICIIFLGPIIVGIVAFIIKDKIYELFTGGDWTIQIMNRLNQWSVGWKEITQKPIWGHGINNYTDWMKVLYPEMYSYHFYYTNPIHNSYLQIWYDTGIVGLISYLLIIINSLFYLFKYHQRSNFQIIGGLFVCASMIYFWTGWALLKEPITNMLWVSLGFIHNTTNRSKLR